MKAKPFAHLSLRRILIITVVVLLFVGAGPLLVLKASAGQLQQRELRISNNVPGQTGVTYRFSFDLFSLATVGSVQLLFCSNSSLMEDPCTAPSGFNAQSATLTNQGGITDFNIHASSTANDVILSRTPSIVGPINVNFELQNVTNPSDVGSYYARILTYASNDASGSATDVGGVAFAINTTVPVSAEVPPYLIFCSGTSITGFDCSTATGNYVDLGTLSSGRTSTGQTQLLAATNADFGYTIRTLGTTLVAGNNIIPALAVPTTSQLGASQFGLNLRANTTPLIGQNPQGPGTATATTRYNQPNRFTFADGDTIASALQVQDYKKFTVSYIVNVNKNQPAGVYVTTLTYLCLANF